MESIENIKSVYRRIEDEARCELNKVQQQIYRISTLRLLLFVAALTGLSILVFLALRVLPGDVAAVMATNLISFRLVSFCLGDLP